MKRNATRAIPFLGIGTAFVALGASGQRAFLAIGLAFLAIGTALLVRGRNARGPS